MRLALEKTRQAIAEGRASPSLMSGVLEHGSPHERIVAGNVAWTTYGAASKTTISATTSLLYFLAKHPEVQRKAQNEIDAITGQQRLPEFGDRDSGDMPYVEAIYREVMRRAPPLPIGLSHRVIQDDVFGGYLLPAGTTIFANIFAMNHDESVHEDPYSFRPERYFDQDGKLNSDSRVLAYGFGRRVCVGKVWPALLWMWLTIASVLACFNIGPDKDTDGIEVPINDEFINDGMELVKSPFRCSIAARSPQVVNLLSSTSI